MGPDGEQFAYAEHVAMAFRPFYTDARSRFASQPYVSPDGHLVSFDGRLDNRAEIQRRFESRPGASDVALVLQAYRRLGLNAFVHLVGDFALAIWDPGNARLVLCCDALGRRPLYYHCTADSLFWSSRTRALLRAAQLSAELDEEFVADFVTNQPSVRTPFRRIGVVPGGHLLVVDRMKADLKRYWSFDPGAEIRYRSDREYEDHFVEVFHEAVACRLASDAPVFCELSGGLDSSSISCYSDRLVRERRVETPAVHTVSYVYDQSASSDETEHMAIVEAQLGRRGLHVRESDMPLLQPLPPGFEPDIPTSSLCFLTRHDFVMREMKRHGSRVLLSGIGGDNLFWSAPDVRLILADLLVQGRLVEVCRSAYAWADFLRVPIVSLLAGACWPLLPARLRAAAQGLGDCQTLARSVGAWYDPAFATRAHLGERLLRTPAGSRFKLPSSTAQQAFILWAMRTFALEPCSSEGYVDRRYPYLDRRFAEFSMAIPLDQKVRLGESRSIVRRSLKGIMPEKVLQRRTKAGPDEALQRALAREWPRLSALVKDPRVSAHGLVDRAKFRTALERARRGMSNERSQLIKTLALELWLRTLDATRAEVTDAAAPPGWRHVVQQGESHGRPEDEPAVRSA